MAAYLIVRMKVTDATAFQKYREAVPAVLEKYGARFLVRGAEVQVLEGSYDGRPLVLLEFPSMETLLRCRNSPEYAELQKLRAGAADLDAWAVPGS
jgi:uncharacterized protein (DUF1330 family)